MLSQKQKNQVIIFSVTDAYSTLVKTGRENYEISFLETRYAFLPDSVLCMIPHSALLFGADGC